MVAFASVACAEPDEDSKLSLQLLSGEEGKCTRGLGEMLMICVDRGRACYNTQHYVAYLERMTKQSVMLVNCASTQHCSYCACVNCLAARASSGGSSLLSSDCSSDLSDSTCSSHHSAIGTDSDSDENYDFDLYGSEEDESQRQIQGQRRGQSRSQDQGQDQHQG